MKMVLKILTFVLLTNTSYSQPYITYFGETDANCFCIREDITKKQFSIEIKDDLNYPIYKCYSQSPYVKDNYVKECTWESSWNGKKYNNSYKIWTYDEERNIYKNKLIYRNKIYIFYTTTNDRNKNKIIGRRKTSNKSY